MNSLEDEECVVDGRNSRCRRRLCCCCCSVCCVVTVVLPVAFLAVLLFCVVRPTMDLDATAWPVADEQGYFKAYKEKGRWMNWWSRDRPSAWDYISKVQFSNDPSNIPSKKEDLDKVLPVKSPYWVSDPGSVVGAPGIRVTWLGHAATLAEVDTATVLTDPMFSGRASPWQWTGGPKRYRPPACTVDQLPDNLNAVVISHNHFDHLDYDSVKSLHKKYRERLHWFVPMDMGSWFTGNFGIKKKNVHQMTWWEEKELPGTEVKIVMTPSNHGCRRGINDEDKALWGSWAIIGPKHRFWFGGDTAYSAAFKQIGRRHGPFDLAAIPIGAYHPWWFMKFFHVDPDQAVMIHQDVGSKQSLGIHWGTFKMTTEFYLEPRTRVKAAMAERGLAEEKFATVDIGETLRGGGEQRP